MSRKWHKTVQNDDEKVAGESTTTSSLKVSASSESLEPPMPVHRVDTMELLLGVDTMEDAANKNEDEGRRAAKRQRSGLTA